MRKNIVSITILKWDNQRNKKMNNREVILNGRKVGDGYPTYVIAEIGINHNGNKETGFLLIDAAAEAGADAVKFQTYITEKRTPKDSPIFDILKKCELPFDAFREFQLHAKKKNVEFFSTPFDVDSLAYLESIQVPFYKVASFDVTNTSFLEKVAQTHKPLILSVGMSSAAEIERAREVVTSSGAELVLLHCITSYPNVEEQSHLSAIYTLREKFDCVIGQSDHTPDIQAPLYAVAAGARVLEKHFKVSVDMDCIDGPVSIDTAQMKKLVAELRRLEKILGRSEIQIRETEKQYQWLRRK